jgi:hypothetical protein
LPFMQDGVEIGEQTFCGDAFDPAAFAAEMEEVAVLLDDLSEWPVESNAAVLEMWASAVDRALHKKRDDNVASDGRDIYSMVHGPTAEWFRTGDSRWATAHLLGDKIADVESFRVERFAPATDDVTALR